MFRPANALLILLLTVVPTALSAQDGVCDNAGKKLLNWSERLGKINTVDPELIPLHYFFVSDIRNEMASFEKNSLQKLRDCPEIDFQQFANKYDDLSFKARNLAEQLKYQKEHVDMIFYRKAEEMLLFGKRDSTHYFLDKALQYNHLQADALIAKAELLLEEEQYDECIDIVHKLYNDVTLNREQEMAVSDYTLKLYEVLYYTGDSLLHAGREAEALDIFTSLETFCKNMPTAYCNDDYYKAIMLSKSGVYKSFLKIAEVARQRGNKEIEEQFLKYAEEYKENNELFDDEPVVVEDTVAVGLAVDEPLQEEIKIEVPVAETENRVEEELQIETQPDCNTLIISGIELLMKGEREAAADIFRQARQIEGCEAVSIEDILKIIGR
ncbi:MAG: hypothetical protein J6W84_08030 [Bacteroidales bacterium]|nr:hypothetical protein [Bacteroidales bacterium]